MAYDFKLVEKNLYAFWLKNKFFDPILKTNKSKNFSIILPPPNVTGHLHLGHAWGGSIQDCIIRYKKLNGYRTLFIPGTDHAGIATQTKFENLLKQQKIDRSKMTDATFLKELHKWALAQADVIHQQWAGLGFALSYKYETFTLDENVNDLVFKTFKTMYDHKLIYRANRLVNWDIKLQTAISNLEVIKKEVKGTMWYFKYYLAGSDSEYLTVATTRPETMFVDTNLVVNPKDARFKKYLGKSFVNPVNGELLPLISDESIEIEFGTGVMKCTPAHAFDDYKIAIKHKIKKMNSCISRDGKLNNYAKNKYMDLAGVDRIEARTQIVAILNNLGLLVKAEPHLHNVGFSERSGEVVEPLFSMQWFIKMAPIIKQLKQLMIKNKPNYFPPRFEKIMQHWLNKTEDWCISRQLLWGHTIPVWYHKKTGKILVSNKAPSNHAQYIKEKDVFDTWYSSGLWPLVCTKYNAKKEIKDFYPVSMLVTGWDIIFFWVARMLFQCSYFDKTISLKNILLTGLIRDEHNQKMSKSLGNGVEPNEVIAQYGADALRTTLISGSPNGEDLIFRKDKLVYNSNFINKIWNINNLVTKTNRKIEKNLEPLNKFIINELNKTINRYINFMDKYNLTLAYQEILHFSWETFANKYLEIMKKGNNQQTINVINYVYKKVLIMLHPFMPFVTEYIYQNKYQNKKSIMLEELSKQKIVSFNTIESDLILDIFSQIKNLRIKNSLKNSKVVEINVVTDKKVNDAYINSILAPHAIKINKISSVKDSAIKEVITLKNYSIEIVTTITNKLEEIERNELLLVKLKGELERSANILSNQNFIKNASKEKIALEEQKQKEYLKQYERVKAIIAELKK